MWSVAPVYDGRGALPTLSDRLLIHRIAPSHGSIAAWREHTGLGNLLCPLVLHASQPDTWPVERADAVLAINMIHISPWTATAGLMAGAARVLPAGGGLFLYGPFIEGRHTDSAQQP